jgi:hypothetical protein
MISLRVLMIVRGFRLPADAAPQGTDAETLAGIAPGSIGSVKDSL